MSGWLLYAFLAAVCFSISQLIDKFTIDKVFGRVEDWMIGVSLSALLPIAGILLFNGVPHIDHFFHIGLALLSGALLIPCFYLYALALKKSTTDVVAALWQSSPIYALIAGYFFLGDQIGTLNFIGIALVILATLAITVPEDKRNLKAIFQRQSQHSRAVFMMMQVACLLMVASQGVADHLVDHYAILDVMLYHIAGLSLSGLLFAFSKKNRAGFKQACLTKAKPMIIGLLLIEGIELIGTYLTYSAYMMGSFSLVKCLLATQPIIVLLILWAAHSSQPGLFRQVQSSELVTKMPIFAATIMGVGFVIL